MLSIINLFADGLPALMARVGELAKLGGVDDMAANTDKTKDK